MPEDLKEAEIELTPYITMAFGNETRIDYGTGHENNIAIFFFCLFRLKLIQVENFKDLVEQVFTAYISTMRKLQTIYILEPAGSHGVWGLDDFHCLVFLWGSAQLINNEDGLNPSSVNDPNLLKEFKGRFIYFEGIK